MSITDSKMTSKDLVEEWYRAFQLTPVASDIYLEILSVTDEEIVLQLSDEIRIQICFPDDLNSNVAVVCESEDDFALDVIHLLGSKINKNNKICDKLSILNYFQQSVIDILDQNNSADDANYCSDGEMEYANHGETIDKEWLESHNLKKKLLAKENEMRQHRTDHDNDTSSEDFFKKSNQFKEEDVFSSTASANVLINDLMTLMKEEQELGYHIEPIDDNIYKWNVKINKFHSDSCIALDLVQLESLFGYT